jgi:hypothetical protein
LRGERPVREDVRHDDGFMTVHTMANDSSDAVAPGQDAAVVVDPAMSLAPRAPSSQAHDDDDERRLVADDDDTTLRPALAAPVFGTLAARISDQVKRLDDAVGTAKASIPVWDNLAWVNAFARAATVVRDVLPTTIDPLERRALAARLLQLMPPALLPDAVDATAVVPAASSAAQASKGTQETVPDGSRAPTAATTANALGAQTLGPAPATRLQGFRRDLSAGFWLPPQVAARTDDDFSFGENDAPFVHPSWSAFLTHGDVVAGALRPGRHERLLAPRSLSPGAAPGPRKTGSALTVSVDEVKGDIALLTVQTATGPSTRRLTSDGRDAGRAELRLDVLSSWMLAAGAGARGLDLRRADDRALLLTFQSHLRARRLDELLARSADATSDATDPDRRADVVEAVVDAAADAVAFSALDPYAVRFCLPHNDWGRHAARMLEDTGLTSEVTPRQGQAQHARRELVWLDAVADSGFVGGAMSAVQQSRAFSRLAVSLLAPLGALPCVSARDGNGVLITLLFEDESGGRQRGPWWIEPSSLDVRQPIAQAWAQGMGLALAEPRGGFAHDIAALPAWMGAFLDTIGGG